SSASGAPIREELKPAIPVKKSVTPEYIICLEDGKKFKSLKRHLRTHYDLSPEEYRDKWGLPHDYPMVAPNYAAARSDLAKRMGLGQRRRYGLPDRPPTRGLSFSPACAKASELSLGGAQQAEMPVAVIAPVTGEDPACARLQARGGA